MQRLNKTLLILVAIILSGSLIGCDDLPPFPTVKINLVDTKHGKLHRYELPKERGVDAPYLGADNLTYQRINKHYTMAPEEWSKLEGYISRLEDTIRKKCR